MDSLEIIAFKVPLHAIGLHDFSVLIQQSIFCLHSFQRSQIQSQRFSAKLTSGIEILEKGKKNSWNPRVLCLQFHIFSGLLETVGYLSHTVLFAVLNAFSSIFARVLLLPSSRSRISNDSVQEFNSTIREFYLLPNAYQPVPTTSCQPKGNQPAVICLFTQHSFPVLGMHFPWSPGQVEKRAWDQDFQGFDGQPWSDLSLPDKEVQHSNQCWRQ